MKRRELQELGLEKEVIDQIMRINQRDTLSHRKKLEGKNHTIDLLIQTYQDYSKQIHCFDQAEVKDLVAGLSQLKKQYESDLVTEKLLDNVKEEVRLSKLECEKQLMVLISTLLEKAKTAQGLEGFKTQVTKIDELIQKDTSLQN